MSGYDPVAYAEQLLALETSPGPWRVGEGYEQRDPGVFVYDSDGGRLGFAPSPAWHGRSLGRMGGRAPRGASPEAAHRARVLADMARRDRRWAPTFDRRVEEGVESAGAPPGRMRRTRRASPYGARTRARLPRSYPNRAEGRRQHEPPPLHPLRRQRQAWVLVIARSKAEVAARGASAQSVSL